MPLRPDLVVEVAYDHMEGTRFRHTAQFQALAPGPRPAVLHLRPARPPRTLRPGRDPGRLASAASGQDRAADRRTTRRALVYTILLLTETTLREHDVQRIAQLHGDRGDQRPPAGPGRRRAPPADRGAGRDRPRPAPGRPGRRRRPDAAGGGAGGHARGQRLGRPARRRRAGGARLGDRVEPGPRRHRGGPARRLRRDHRGDPAAPGRPRLCTATGPPACATSWRCRCCTSCPAPTASIS